MDWLIEREKGVEMWGWGGWEEKMDDARWEIGRGWRIEGRRWWREGEERVGRRWWKIEKKTKMSWVEFLFDCWCLYQILKTKSLNLIPSSLLLSPYSSLPLPLPLKQTTESQLFPKKWEVEVELVVKRINEERNFVYKGWTWRRRREMRWDEERWERGELRWEEGERIRGRKEEDERIDSSTLQKSQPIILHSPFPIPSQAPSPPPPPQLRANSPKPRHQTPSPLLLSIPYK